MLNAGATDNVTTGLLSLHRGLFVKFYCIANDTQPVKADGDEVVADDFTPITFTAGSSTMERAGSPTEADFIQYHTRLLDTDVLNVPLAMAGAQTLPLDLTDASTSTRQQVNFKLTRLAARFDVVNKADESRFTIESISMLNARRAAGYFPIVACGTYPAADADLMTTADKPFTGDNANIGTQTGAFYCYPSLQEDVETIAHFKAAQHFDPQVDFILDIGGQDIKCFKIKDNAIDSIMLNEACSSGCGSFIETFAKSMGYTAEEFARLGLFSQYPVDLGSRCTVFMNSSVKQAQKDGAGVEDISAGLSMSVVKNVLYKVIRARNADELGKHIVVQGGTFLNDAVLRSFEKEIGHDVIRPDIAGLMGAYGAAIYAKGICPKEQPRSSMLGAQQLENFQHESKPVVCQGCTNHCNLTVNIFAGGERYISGNRCEKPLGLGKERQLPDLYRFKLEQIRALSEDCSKRAAAHTGKRGVIGLPLGLNMYENLFFWEAFFRNLDFDIVVSDLSSRALYAKGQYSVPSDTACYPAKLMHGHIENLLDKGVTTIFYPCMSYNFDESKGDNHFNCPVVAYYPELLASNVEKLKQVRYLYPYLDLAERKTFPKKIWQALQEYYPDLTLREVKRASDCAYESYHCQREQVKEEGRKALEFARQKGLKTIILCGRPYHVDPEINHGINQLITSLGLVVVTEDCVADLVQPVRPDVLNQWTYHSRLYNAAEYVVEHRDCELVQLVSFGCGIDAITTDEVSAILARGQRLYTQLKIDEINNLGAVRIRIRSLIGAVRERDANTQQ